MQGVKWSFIASDFSHHKAEKSFEFVKSFLRHFIIHGYFISALAALFSSGGDEVIRNSHNCQLSVQTPAKEQVNIPE